MECVAIVVAALRGCGGIGRRARFRSVWGRPRGGSSPLIRIAVLGRKSRPLEPRRRRGTLPSRRLEHQSSILARAAIPLAVALLAALALPAALLRTGDT